MVKKLNGIHVNVTADQPKSKPRSKHRDYSRPHLPTHKLNAARAAEAVQRACIKSKQFKGLAPFQIVFVVQAACQDEFLPLPKMVVKKKGDNLSRALDLLNPALVNINPQ